ncbi:30S ribosomal protein S2 [Candidatus Parcubacteria bacterium 4484_255]|nr:MAG: 30S ribosomal protein S2 [Candidatus Parcubacteria bacterium 4484_255]
MAKAGAQLGHFKNRCLPKMKPFIYALRNNIYFIDLEKTVVKLQEAVNFVMEEVSAKSSNILFLGTKPIAKDVIERCARKAGVPYVNQRWLGGTLTNFSTISKLIAKFNKMLEESESGAWEKYTKKERLGLSRELEKLKKMVGGVRDLKKKPDLLYIIDIVYEKTALSEAIKCKVPVVAIVDTNANPELVDYPIPANDDALKSVEMISQLIAEAVIIGKSRIQNKERDEGETARIRQKKEGEKKDNKSNN